MLSARCAMMKMVENLRQNFSWRKSMHCVCRERKILAIDIQSVLNTTVGCVSVSVSASVCGVKRKRKEWQAEQDRAREK